MVAKRVVQTKIVLVWLALVFSVGLLWWNFASSPLVSAQEEPTPTSATPAATGEVVLESTVETPTEIPTESPTAVPTDTTDSTPTPSLPAVAATPSATPAIASDSASDSASATDSAQAISPTPTSAVIESNPPEEATASAKAAKPSRGNAIWNRLKELLNLRSVSVEAVDYQLNEPIVVEIKDFAPEELTVSLTDSNDEPVLVTTEVTDTALLVTPSEHVQPGWYTMTVSEGERILLTQDFSWGVLALNPNKSMYAPDEQAMIAITVLNQYGSMVCDAQVNLVIENTDLNIRDELSTENGLIINNPECKQSKFTLKPDYEAQFQLAGEGTYSLALTAVTDLGAVTVQDAIVVQADLPFDIERISATRVYPPDQYPVIIRVTPLEDFTGYVEEVVPGQFTLVEHSADEVRIGTEENTQTLRWNVAWQAGEQYSLRYVFQAPPVSPDFYLLGPVSIKKTEQIIEQPTLDSINFDTVNQASEASNIIEDSVIVEPVLEEASASAGLDEVNTIESSEVLVFQEQRQWQLAIDAIYSVLAFWDGGTPPTGWTCVSCTSGDPYYQVLPRGAATSGGTGGATTHTHPMSFVSHTASGTNVNNRKNGTAYTTNTHTHGWSGAATGTASNLPPYRHLKIIKFDSNGVPSAIPNGVILMFDAAPGTGWTRYTTQDNQFIRGENDATGTGGAATHTHSFSGSLTATGDTRASTGRNASFANAAHTHSVAGTTNSVSHLPDRVDVLLYKNTSGSNKFFTGAEIAMIEGTVGTTWTVLSNSGGDFHQSFLRGASSYAKVSGVASHNHTNATVTSGSPSASSLARTGNPAGSSATSTHTHSATVGFTTSDNLPPYRDVVIVKKNTVGNPPGQATNQNNLFYDKAYLTDTTPTFNFRATDGESNPITYQFQLSTDPVFGTLHVDALSETDLGFANVTTPADTDPFNSGDTISYTVQSGDALSNGTTYFYRVRGYDPDGSESWGSWSTVRSLTIDTAFTDGNAWFETHEAQFDLDTLTGNAVVNATNNTVEVTSGSGTVTSTGIVASAINSGETNWGFVVINDSQTNGSIVYQVYYDVTGTPTIVPDGVLAGNSTGFSGGPLNLNGLSTSTYATLYLRATLTYSGGTPQLQDWLVAFGSINTAPNVPTNLVQAKTDDTVLAVGDWTNETSVVFSADVSDTDNPDTLQLCVEIQPLATSFTNSETNCGSGAAYAGSAVAAEVTIGSLSNNTEYHWQARVKDAAGDYSTWLSYGGNAESARDVGVDTSAPTGGTVYDGTETGVDKQFNTGSLSSLSANWSGFNAAESGLDFYEYAIGTSSGGTNVVNWTNVGTSTSVTVNSLTLQTSQMYFFTVRATDLAGNTSTGASSNGQLVAPTLTFTVSPTDITFSQLSPANSYSDTEQVSLTTSTNAYGGYVIRAYTTGLLASLADPGLTIANFSAGTYSSPAGWGVSDLGFGYTSSDTLVQGSNRFNDSPCPGLGSPPCYAPFSQTAPGDVVADHTSAVTGSPISNEEFTVTMRVTVDDAQPAANYTTTVIYAITPQY